MTQIDAKLTTAYNNYTASTDRTPGKVDEGEARELISIAEDLNEGSLKCCGLFGGTKGDKHLSRLVNAHEGAFDVEGKNLIAYWLKNHKVPEGTTAAERGKKIAEWKCDKETWHCHWFPMQARVPGGDALNNLYAEGGALAKYDQAFGGKSRDHELKNNAKPHDADRKKFGWWGHCNNASEVACLLEQPKHEVEFNGVTFTPNDIAGLLVKVSDSLADRVDFKGQRYNGPSDDPNDPSPADFMKYVLKGWGSEDTKRIPFVLDIDRTEQVWNYPYDQGEVYESDKAPEGFDSSALPSGGKAKFYRAEVKGSGFDDQARVYQFWIQEASGKSGWIAGEDEKISPDFAWRPHPKGDLDKAENWKTDPSKQNNPFVLAENVFKIYKASIS